MPNDGDKDQPKVDEHNPRSNPKFWAFHPIGRGVGSEIASSLWGNPIAGSGFAYGALSGALNVAIRPLVAKSLKQINSPEVKAAAYVSTVALPWATSYGIMRQLAKNGHTFFKVNPGVALLTAATVEVLGYANRDLLGPK